MAGLDRGKLVVLFIFGMSFIAGGLAWWHHFQKGQRAKAFWGTDVAVLIDRAPLVELLELQTGDEPPSQAVEEFQVDGKVRPVIRQKDITQARGLIHIRGALNEDANFAWEKARDAPPVWQFVLRFTDGTQQAALMIDVPSQRVRLIGTDREACVSPMFEGIEGLIQREFSSR